MIDQPNYTQFIFSQPGVAVSFCEDSESKKYNDKIYKEIKSTIVPRPYSYQNILKYLYSNFDCEEVTVYDSQYTIFKENLRLELSREIVDFSPIFLESPETERNKELYSKLHKLQGDKKVYVDLEKNTCFFDTNLHFLNEKLSMLRWVNQEDYDNDSVILKELIHLIKNPVRTKTQSRNK